MLPPRLQPSLLLLCLSALAGPAVLPATATATCRAFPGQGWDTATPASVGLDAAKLDEFRAAAGSGPGVVIKDGLLVYSWGDQSFRPGWASSSKALFSTLLFFAIQEGLVGSVDDRIADLGWPLTQADETMTFRHLANMVSGYARPVGPGTRWAYNDYGVTLFKRSVLERVFGVNAADPLAVTDLIDDPAHLGPLRFEDGGLVLVW